MKEWQEPSFLEIIEYNNKREKWEQENPEFLSFLEIVKRIYAYDYIYQDAKRKYEHDDEKRLQYASDRLEILRYECLANFLQQYDIEFTHEVLVEYIKGFASTLKRLMELKGSDESLKVKIINEDTCGGVTQQRHHNNLNYAYWVELIKEIPNAFSEFPCSYYSCDKLEKLWNFNLGEFEYLNESVFISREFFSGQHLETLHLKQIPIFPLPIPEPGDVNTHKTCYQEVAEASKAQTGLCISIKNYLNREEVRIRYRNDMSTYHLFKREIEELIHRKSDKHTKKAQELLDEVKRLQVIEKELADLKPALKEYQESDRVTESKLKLVLAATIRVLVDSSNGDKYRTWEDPNMDRLYEAISPHLQNEDGKLFKAGLGKTQLKRLLNEAMNYHKDH